MMSYFREIHQHLSHLVPSLATSYVDDDVAVGKLGHGLTNDCLPAPESAWYADGASLDARKESIKYTLSNDERRI